MTTGERIKERRKALGMSVDKLASIVGKNRATVYRYESDAIESMPIETIEPIAKALRCSPSYLLGWDDEDDYYTQNDVAELAQFLKDNPAHKALFDASRKVKAEDLERALKAVGIFIDE